MAMRRVMGEAYICDFKGSYLGAFWRNYTTCKYVESAGTGRVCEISAGGDGRREEVFFFNGSGKVVANA